MRIPSEEHAQLLRSATDLWSQRLIAQLAIWGPSAHDEPSQQRQALTSAVAAMHTGLIPLAREADHPAVATVWPAYLVLAAPLAAWAGGPPPTDETALRTLVVMWLARHAAQARPAALVGTLYALAEALRALEQDGVQTATAWELFAAAVGAAPLTAAEATLACDAAQETMGALASLASALDTTMQRPLAQLAGVLNPAAGKHAIPQRLAEIEAAVRAGERSWTEFPYYQLRYAARGIRYTWSDSAWLVTLCDLPQAAVNRQVDWLGQLLATRGMPRRLLERHLELLHEELTRALPAEAARYEPLALAAQELKAVRQAQVSEALSAELGADFDAMVGPALARQLPATGLLIASALADERAGIAGALSSLLSWLTDPGRFPAAWIAAVRRQLERARELA